MLPIAVHYHQLLLLIMSPTFRLSEVAPYKTTPEGRWMYGKGGKELPYIDHHGLELARSSNSSPSDLGFA